METETTDPAGAGDFRARSLEWHVALAQLPGVPQRLQAACLETMREHLRNLSVTARRQHVWHSVQPACDAAAPDDVALGEAGVRFANKLRLRPPFRIENAAYRVAQEAVSNVVRHAAACSLRVEICGTERLAIRNRPRARSGFG